MRVIVAAIGRLRDGPEAAMTVDYLQRATQAGRQIGFKGFDLARPVRFVTLVLVVAAFAIIAHNPGLTLLAVFGCFAAWAPLHWLWRHLFRRRPAVVVGGAPADEDTD